MNDGSPERRATEPRQSSHQEVQRTCAPTYFARKLRSVARRRPVPTLRR